MPPFAHIRGPSVALFGSAPQRASVSVPRLSPPPRLASPTIQLHTQDLVGKLAIVERAVGGKLLTAYPCATDAPSPLKKFRANFAEFVDRFVGEGGAELISGGVLQKLVEWLTVIASSSWLPFRHTAALATGQLIKSLIKEVLHRTTKDLDKRQRQVIAEEKKSGGKQTNRSRGLRAQVDKMKQVISSAEKDVVTAAFNSLFMHLYRDTRGVVRADLLKYYGSWVALYPKLFLKDQRTKYLGWMLHDADAQVRVNAVKALNEVYKSTGNSTAKLQNFTLRFKRRIVEMIQDAKTKVACEVFGLLETLLGRGVLTDEDIFAACDAVFMHAGLPDAARSNCGGEARKLSSAAARFSLLAIDGLRGANGATATASAASSACDDVAMRRIRAFEAFVVDHASHGSEVGEEGSKDAILRLCDYAVDAFWKHTGDAGGASFLQNWKSMIMLLLADDEVQSDSGGGGDGDCTPAATDHQTVLRIFCSAAKRACFPNEGLNASVAVKSTSSRLPGKKAASNVSHHRKEISRELVDARWLTLTVMSFLFCLPPPSICC